MSNNESKTIYGTNGNDDIDGGNKNDLLVGNGGDDVINGSHQDDTIYGDFENPIMRLDDTVTLLGEFSVDYNGGDTTRLTTMGTWDDGNGNSGQVLRLRNGTDSSIEVVITAAGQGGYSQTVTVGANSEYFVAAPFTSATYKTNFVGVKNHTKASNPNAFSYSQEVDVSAYGGNDIIDGGNHDDTIYGGGGNDEIDGGNGKDIIYGGSGNDEIDGGNQNDEIYGGDGNDTIYAGNDHDIVDGGAGNDTIELSNGNDTADGGDGDDYIFGDNGNDTLSGGSGNDEIIGHNGRDIINSGAGDDLLSGGNDKDTYIFNIGDGHDIIDDDDGGVQDIISFGDGIAESDLVFNQDGDDLIIQYTDNDTVTLKGYFDGDSRIKEYQFSEGGSVNSDDVVDTVDGSNDDDNISGETAAEFIDAGDGNDIIDGGAGNDVLRGGAGRDRIRGWLGNDTIYGGADNDELYGDHGDDKVYGEDGDDLLVQRGGNDIIDGGAGNDRVTYEFYNNLTGIDLDLRRETGQVIKAQGVDQIISIESFKGTNIDDIMVGDDSGVKFDGAGGNDTITGGAGADILRGGAGNDTITALGGNDVLFGGLGDDVISGGEGNDTYTADLGNDSFDGGTGLNSASYLGLSSGITANLSAASDQVQKAGGEIDQITNVFRFTGTNYDDTITARANTVTLGADGNDILNGVGGAEYLYGGAGNDTLNGKGYRDRLYGGAGDDTFIFERGGGQDTVINDDAVSTNDVMSFASGVDHDQLWFEQVGADLVIDVIGTNDSVTMQGWYGPNFTVDNIQSGDGYSLTAADVQTLVDAMASLSQPALGQTELSDAGLDDDLATTLASTWAN